MQLNAADAAVCQLADRWRIRIHGRKYSGESWPWRRARAEFRGRWNRRARAGCDCGCARLRAQMPAWCPRGRTPFPIGSVLQCAPGPLPPDTLAASGLQSPSPATQRVLKVQADFIFVAQRRRDSALRVLCSRVGRLHAWPAPSRVPAAASSMAARSPATPAPMTRKSVSGRSMLHLRKMVSRSFTASERRASTTL